MAVGDKMSEQRKSIFKTRFSILSLLPSRHPPLTISYPRPLDIPPSQPVSRYPTIISDVSPVHSEYPVTDSISSPRILDEWNVPSSSQGSSATPSPNKRPKRDENRPPPLDLSHTKAVFPGPKNVVAMQSTEIPNQIVPEAQQNPAPPVLPVRPLRPARPATPAPPAKSKAKPRIILDDPFEFAVVEPGHKYTSWKGGKVDIKPGQVIPHGTFHTGTPTIRGIPDESVLHNILLTPTYLDPSPTFLPSSPSASPSSSGRHHRRTMIDRAADLVVNAARKSRVIPKGILKLRDEESANKSVQLIRDREQKQMDQFRRVYTSGSNPSPGPAIQIYTSRSASSLKGERSNNSKAASKSKSKTDKKKLWKLGILIAIIALAVLTIALCTTLLTRSNKTAASSISSPDINASSSIISSSPTSSTSAPTPASSTSRGLTTCLDEFSSASTSPTTYPCADCVPLLTSTTNDYLSALDDANATGVGAALQFCALMDVKLASTGLDTWGKDSSPCEGWDGVTCDERGRVTELKLQYPDIPSNLPSSLANMVSLESFSIMGNSSTPTGAFPAELLALTNLTTIDLEYTALTGPVDSLDFPPAQNLTSLYLVNNQQLGSTLPDLSKNSLLVTL
ncbi:hypothetical protein BCR39DRAFT_87556 [Naematelia encephala]|uniref:Leucine-rich repeat-containing N-terminal plant-type domain-containing protein n=1 Tax=Naematelia encephala TaxID=71784 RepID=A0A1Y2BAC4_9TREE|nr:hypothetical protein BCR39DRAFT_87556 [Naematelia encephala]